uniref:Protein diaphanous (Trinotate prediction) n=1 Tax=Henneguya salminicola TaxID=69463 RepID=A0A6G3MDV5_HENSL
MVVVRSACEEITHCNKLMDIFQIILLCGNYMNAGSRNEGSFGFELSFLNSLADTKTQSGSSFIHFLAEIIEEHYSQLIGFDKNLTSIQSAMKGLYILYLYTVNDDSVTKVVNQVAKTVSQLESNLSKFETPFNSDDKFPEILTDFHKKASEQLIILQEMFDNMKKSFDDICNYFSITTKFTIEEFFSLFNKFMEDWNVTVNFLLS